MNIEEYKKIVKELIEKNNNLPYYVVHDNFLPDNELTKLLKTYLSSVVPLGD